MKIKIDLNGGLGNQMFQYAFGKSLSLHYNSELYFNSSSIALNPDRKLMIDKVFNLKIQNDNRIDYLSIIERGSYYDGLEKYYYNLEKNNNYYFFGYWQNEAFFKMFENEIRKDFDLKPKKIEKGSLLVQVRRGDFVNNIKHEYCDLRWYYESISLMCKITEIKQIIFASDDIEWVKNNFKSLELETIFLDTDEGKTFETLVSCENFIISNSSFGWWGAWLSKAQNVICPKIWFPEDPTWNTQLNNWIKI